MARERTPACMWWPPALTSTAAPWRTLPPGATSCSACSAPRRNASARAVPTSGPTRTNASPTPSSAGDPGHRLRLASLHRLAALLSMPTPVRPPWLRPLRWQQLDGPVWCGRPGGGPATWCWTCAPPPGSWSSAPWRHPTTRPWARAAQSSSGASGGATAGPTPRPSDELLQRSEVQRHVTSNHQPTPRPSFVSRSWHATAPRPAWRHTVLRQAGRGPLRSSSLWLLNALLRRAAC